MLVSVLMFSFLFSLQAEDTVQPNSYFLHFAGDLMAHRPNFSMSEYSRIYDDVVPLLADGDLNFVNLEFVIDPDREYSSYPLFNVHPEYVQAAIDAGFSVFSVANNHSADFRGDGILATRESIQQLKSSPENSQRKLYFSGIKDLPDSGFRLEIIPMGDWRIGFVAATGLLNDWEGRELVNFTFYSRERQAFLKWISEVRSQVDLLIVSYHDGVEYQIFPDGRKQRYMRQMAQAGADIVWGHHPHVLQPMELLPVRRAGVDYHAVIIYSAGNFISSQTWQLEWKDYHEQRAYTGDSAIYRVLLMPRGQHLIPASVQAIPVTHFTNSYGDIVVRRMLPLIFESMVSSGGLSEQWQQYYLYRYARMRSLFSSPYGQDHVFVP